jgi:hypothetical protein
MDELFMMRRTFAGNWSIWKGVPWRVVAMALCALRSPKMHRSPNSLQLRRRESAAEPAERRRGQPACTTHRRLKAEHTAHPTAGSVEASGALGTPIDFSSSVPVATLLRGHVHACMREFHLCVQ